MTISLYKYAEVFLVKIEGLVFIEVTYLLRDIIFWRMATPFLVILVTAILEVSDGINLDNITSSIIFLSFVNLITS